MSVEQEDDEGEGLASEEGSAPADEGTLSSDLDLQGLALEGRDADRHTDLHSVYNAIDVNVEVFDELKLPESHVQEVQAAWHGFITSADSREAAGEALYTALYECAPTLQGLFKTPRAVMALRIANGVSQIVGAISDSKALKLVVETFGFQHLDLEVTVPRVSLFRDAVLELLQVELGTRFSDRAKEGWSTLLNYVGGAFVFVRVKYAERLRILAASWASANKRTSEDDSFEESVDRTSSSKNAQEAPDHKAESMGEDEQIIKGGKAKGSSWLGSRPKGRREEKREKLDEHLYNTKMAVFENTVVPRSYEEMFAFNAAVMGFGQCLWMNEVLASFDAIVRNVSNIARLQEECDVLSLRLAKYNGASIALPEYKAVMLASLRSLVPKGWNSAHEVAWSWLWDNVERMIKSMMGKPAAQERALQRFWRSLDEEAQGTIRREIYSQFFTVAPSGQEYFKQSTTRLHFIADRVRWMSLEIYREPAKMVEEISGLGLRHVGYGIPTDLFGPFVTVCVKVVRSMTTDDLAETAFRWSLSLISRILVRVINEGATIVMKAINANSGQMLRKAVSVAPRGKRALWVLNIQVGTQSISPLLWAIETGSQDAAKAIIVDLLTIRADRDRYYYGVDTLFERHPDIVKRLCTDAPLLLPTFLDGLIWRCRTTENGLRRVNYYIKHLLVDADGKFSQAIGWLTQTHDPKIACHPIVSLVTDMVWTGVAFRTFLSGKTWFLFTLVIFILSQSILNHLAIDGPKGPGGSEDLPEQVRLCIFIARCFIYLCSMGQWVFYHVKRCIKDYRTGDLIQVIGRLRVPMYLFNWQDLASFFLMLALGIMLCCEPLLRCFHDFEARGFTTMCHEGRSILLGYSILSSVAMLLYFLLLSDMSVFSTRVSAFSLVFGRVLSEVALFLFGLAFIAGAFAAAVSALEQEDPDFPGIPGSFFQLVKATFGMLSGSHYNRLNEEPALEVAIVIYVIATVIFLLNLLVAQLTCAYQTTYQDMLGYARLNRGKIVADTMPSVAKSRWESFIMALRLDECIEFGEGDIGLAGGVQVVEPASCHYTTVDMIRRYGGSTSPSAQWPPDDLADEEDRFDRVEQMVEKAVKRLSKAAKRGGANAASLSGGVALTDGAAVSGMSSNSGDSHSSNMD